MKTKIDLIGTENILTRPIIKTVIRDISRQLLKFDRDIYSFLNVNDKIVKKKNKQGELKSINAPLSEFYVVEYTETINDGHELELKLIRPDQVPVYVDTDINAYLIPMTQSKKMSMNVKYYSQSKESIMSKINMLRRITASGETACIHELEYAYPIPANIVTILSHLNDLKNKRLNPIIGIDAYVYNTFDSRSTFILPADGMLEKVNLSIREAQLNVQGYITGDLGDITSEYDDDYSMWSISFTYEFAYDAPVSLLFRYPIMVYNTPVKKAYRKYIKPKTISLNAKYSLSERGFDTMSNHQSILTILDGRHYLHIPETDDPDLPETPSMVQRLFSVLCQVSTTDLHMLFNINDIPKVTFKDTVTDFLLNTESDFVHLFRASIFYIELYKNGKRDTTADIRLRPNGDIVTMNELDLKGYYQVSFSMIVDIDMLGKEATARLKEYVRNELEKLDDPDNASEHVQVSIDKVTTCLTILNIPASNIVAAINSNERSEDVVVLLESARYLRPKTVEIAHILTSLLNVKTKD